MAQHAQRDSASVAGPPGGDAARATLTDVLKWEQARIDARRKVVNLPTSDGTAIEEDLAGLALSGGGIRSACFNMGLMQALHRFGLFRCFDYLSTVSGGGYIGLHVSTWIRRQKRPLDHDSFPLGELNDGHCQNPSVRQLIFGGDYIARPISAFNKYLIGVFLNNVAIFSLLVACAALIAWLYRCLDYRDVRDRLAMLSLGNDLLTPFLPSAVFFLVWMAAWVTSYFRSQAEAPGRVARQLLRVLLASLLVGCAMLVGNGDIPLPWAATGAEPFSVPDYIWMPVVIAIFILLLPVLRPSRLIASATRPRRPSEKWIFHATCMALLVGVPLVLVGLMGRENISGYSTWKDRGLAEADVRSWPHVCRMIARLRSSTPAEGVPAAQHGSLTATDRPGDTSESASESQESSAAPNIAVLPADWQQGVVALADLENRTREIIESLQEERLRMNELLVCESVESAYQPDTWNPDRWQRLEMDDYVERCFRVVTWMTGLSEDKEAMGYWDQSRKSLRARESFITCLNSQLLLSPFLTHRLVDEVNAALERERTVESARDGAWSSQLVNARDAALAAIRAPQTRYDIGRANRGLLEVLWPDAIRPQADIQRRVVIVEDQWFRLQVAAVALLLFAVFGLVDMNATSMHRYYRTRLASAFLVPPDRHHGTLALSDLDTTEYGGPYHLVGTTVSLPGNRRDAKDDELSIRLPATDPDHDPRRSDTLLFSSGYTGSVATGYVRTAEYQNRIVGLANQLTVDEAMALSGAAVSPSQNRNLLIAFLMFSLNLRLGQWLPHPRRSQPAMRPRLHYLLYALIRNEKRRPYVFVSDGGHNENLGLVELLKRRCRLIVVADAGCDPQHRFDDLARAIRTARVFGGVRIEPLDAADHRAWSLAPLQLHAAPTAASVDANGTIAAEHRMTRQHFVAGRILYPADANRRGPSEGLLVYLKPSLTGDESIDLLQYQRENPHFPHQPTSDQVFDSAQVESYRALGYHIGEELCRLIAGVPRPHLESPVTRDDSDEEAELAQFRSGFTDADGGFGSIGELTAALTDSYNRLFQQRPERASREPVTRKG